MSLLRHSALWVRTTIDTVRQLQTKSLYSQLSAFKVWKIRIYNLTLWVLNVFDAVKVSRVFPFSLFLGLTALRSDEVIDLMIKEYPTKHSEYSVILQERERQRIAKEYSVRIVTDSDYY